MSGSQEPSRPVILLVADSVDGERAAFRAIEASGASVVATLRIDSPADALDRHSGHVIWIELSRDLGVSAEPALACARRAARDGEAVVVAFPPELIDHADAEFGNTSATLLVLPDEAERIAALSIALNAPASPGVEESKADRDLERLRRLSEELNRVARSLSRAMPPAPLTGYAAPQSDYSAEPGDLGAPAFPSVEEVRKVIRMRRLRDRFVDGTLLADPAWDMLLDLFAARIDDDDVAVSSLCIAAAVPATTALRWIRTMTENGMFERNPDPQDARRVYIKLADSSTRAMAAYFQALRRAEGVSI